MNTNLFVSGACLGAIVSLLLTLIPAYNRLSIGQRLLISTPIGMGIGMVLHFLYL